eukprot:gene20073-26789_t
MPLGAIYISELQGVGEFSTRDYETSIALRIAGHGQSAPSPLLWPPRNRKDNNRPRHCQTALWA